MIKSKFLVFKLILLVPVLTGWAIYRHLIPSIPLRVVELYVYVLLFFIIVGRQKPPSIIWIILCLISWAVSAILNSSEVVLYLLFIRSMLLYYIIAAYIAQTNCYAEDLKGLFYFVWILLILQVPVAVIKYFTIGVGETPLGLCGTNWTLYIFLIGVCYSIAFYLHFSNRKYLWYILGFMIFGLIGGKRAIVFFFPILIFFIILIYDLKVLLKPKLLILSGLIVFIVIYTSVRFLPTLNPDNKVWGEFNVKYAFDYALDYNNASTRELGAIGRTSGLKMAISKTASGGVLSLLFGNGAGILTKTSIDEYDRRDVIKEQYDIGYGATALVYLIIQVGFLGALFYLFFLISLGRYSWTLRHNESDQFWKAFHLGTIGVIFIISFISFFYDTIQKDPVVMTLVYTLIGISIARFKMVTFTIVR